jgi:hypothetical protein
LFQPCGFQQPFQRRLNVGLPAQATVEFETQPREVRMGSDHNEAHVLQERRIDHAPLNRAVAERRDGGPEVGRYRARVDELVCLGRAAERLERAHAAADQVDDDLSDQAARQAVGPVARLGSHRRQQHGVSADRCGGKQLCPRHRPWRRVEDVAQTRGLDRPRLDDGSAVQRRRTGDLPARPPLQHDHRQPGFLLEFRIGEMIVAVQGRRIDLPEHTSARVLGQLLEAFEPQRRDSS